MQKSYPCSLRVHLLHLISIMSFKLGHVSIPKRRIFLPLYNRNRRPLYTVLTITKSDGKLCPYGQHMSRWTISFLIFEYPSSRHVSPPPSRSIVVFCVVFCRSLFVLLSFLLFGILLSVLRYKACKNRTPARFEYIYNKTNKKQKQKQKYKNIIQKLKQRRRKQYKKKIQKNTENQKQNHILFYLSGAPGFYCVAML
jgi:hypothetical protein